MYLDIFGLRQLPFRLRPDPAFWYADTAARRAHDDLQSALRRRAPLTVVSGEAGVGKSLLVEATLASCSPLARPVVRINQPEVSWAELTEAIAFQLAAAAGGGGGAPLATLLAETAASAGPPLLLLDHAHLFAPASLQSLLKLAMGGSRLGVVLQARSGGASPWTEARGGGAAIAPIALLPLAAGHVEAYVESRLRTAGAGRRNLFTPGACAQLFVHTRGVPRAINVLCDLALTLAAARHLERATESEIREATQDPRWHELRAPDRACAPAPEPAPDPSGTIEAARTQQVGARIVVVKGARAVADLALVPGRLQIGRASDNDLALESRYVSRRHCELITVGDGPQAHTILVDLGSRNGTLVNGRRIKRHRLTQGDVVQLGDHELRCLGAESGELGGNRIVG